MFNYVHEIFASSQTGYKLQKMGGNGRGVVDDDREKIGEHKCVMMCTD